MGTKEMKALTEAMFVLFAHGHWNESLAVAAVMEAELDKRIKAEETGR